MCWILFCAGCKKETNEVNISVITYNVAGLPQIISSSNPVLYTTEIGKLLNEFSIVQVQEDFCYHDSLLLNNTHPYRTETTGCVPGGDGLNTFSVFPIANVERVPWDDCTGADCLTPKGFSYSQISFPGGGVIDFYNLHCNAGANTESLEARRKNIAQLCAYLQQHSEGKAVIVMGDFNCRYTREGDTIRAMLDLGFRDVWLEMNRSGSVPDFSPDPLRDCTPNRNSFNCEIVDKIFYRSNPDIEITPTFYSTDDPRFYYNGNDTLPLSDHWPVIANFKISFK